MIEATVRNLREIAPTVYYNVPRGLRDAAALPSAAWTAASLFARLQAFCYAARRSRLMCASYERLGLETMSEIVPMLTSFGSTETGASAISVTDRAREPGVVGIPNPGVEVKLVPNAGKLEARVKSPSITPGYWRQPELTEAAFDEEGYYPTWRRAALRRPGRPGTRLPV